jgi:hypothetical protein
MINRGYLVLLSAEFQGFCRELHIEAIDTLMDHVDKLTAQAQPPAVANLGVVLRQRISTHRKLETGNPNAGNIGADFNFLFVTQTVWSAVALKPQQDDLEDMNHWRNAIAHHDYKKPVCMTPSGTYRTSPLLRDCQRYRRVCEQLAPRLDDVVGSELGSLIGRRPW